MENFDGSVNLTFEIYCRDPVISFYSSKSKFLCLYFSEGSSQIYEITYIKYRNNVIFKRPWNEFFLGLGQFDIWNLLQGSC